ncbi:hypothetical protein [Burkholderia pyrrocinia]|uniref:hypothetical protein n=1 Tax=Burkholderia pyrrocinia TaxID=60550 RepID=UPI0015897B0E|nr:hypothetical protein [Burkholderia pyrrocinia]
MNKWLIAGLVALPGLAFASWTCPSGSGPHVIDGIGYTNEHYQPRIHFNGEVRNNWSYLSYYYGVNKDYGKAILALAISAYHSRAKVMVKCSRGDVYGIWLSDDGSMSPD